MCTATNLWYMNGTSSDELEGECIYECKLNPEREPLTKIEA